MNLTLLSTQGPQLKPLGQCFAATALLATGLVLSGCSAPISAQRVTTRQAYSQVEANAIRSAKPSTATRVILHRYGLETLATAQPDQAVRQLHEKALSTGERGLLFALSELSYAAGQRLDHSVRPWDARDPRDYYLATAVYAWLFLFGEAQDPKPSPFDRRFRDACDFYNAGLGLALTKLRATNGAVQLVSSRRQLPVGQLEVAVTGVTFHQPIEGFEQILLADQLRVKGLSVRNREPGLGAPLLMVKAPDLDFGVRACVPATVLLRAPDSLAKLGAPDAAATLEVYTSLDETTFTVGDTRVPLELDLTAYRAYTLSQSKVWQLGRLGFLAPAQRFSSRLTLNQPFEPNRIPVVYVHGTFSSPVTWSEMANSLTADPVLRKHYQIWTFMYGSGNPLAQSLTDLREALVTEVNRLDPAGTNAILRQMVVVGHSQGGLLTKGTAIDAGDRLWRVFSTNRLENLDISESQRAELRRLAYIEPLPFVKRVVFIATPHRGSYLANGLARRLAQKLVSLPGALVSQRTELMKLTSGSEGGHFLKGRIPTSLDGMSPRNPGLLALAEIPIAPGIKAHSIIPVRGNGDYRKGKDGLVTFESAHLDGVESEYIVRSQHSCLNHPATIEEVRRIMREHLKSADKQ